MAWNPRAWVEPPRVQILVVVANIQTGILGSGSDPRTRSGGDERRKAPSAVTQTNPEKLAGAPGRVLFFFKKGQAPWNGFVPR